MKNIFIPGLILILLACSFTNNALSVELNSIPFEITAESPTEIFAYDTSDNGNGSDVWVRFNAASAQQSISEYRVIMIPEGFGSFSLEEANLLSDDRYTVVQQNGSAWYQTSLDVNMTDVNGNAIQQDFGYYVKILSVADGVNADVNSLTENTPLFYLHIPNFLKADEKTVGRVLYFDYEPDVHFVSTAPPQNTVFFDLFNDGIAELSFTFTEINYTIFSEYWLNMSACSGTMIMPSKLVGETCISPYNYWSSASVEMAYYYGGDNSQYGLWLGSPGYLGMKMQKDGDTLYCWLNMSANTGSVTIYDVAVFNMKTIGVPEFESQSNEMLQIVPNPFGNILNIQFDLPLKTKGEVRVLNANGAVVYSRDLLHGLSSKSIDMSNHPSGIYFVIFNDGISNRFYKAIKK